MKIEVDEASGRNNPAEIEVEEVYADKEVLIHVRVGHVRHRCKLHGDAIECERRFGIKHYEKMTLISQENCL